MAFSVGCVVHYTAPNMSGSGRFYLYIKMRLCDVNAKAFPQGVELIPLEHRYNRYQRMVFSSGGSCGAIIMEIGHALRVVV